MSNLVQDNNFKAAQIKGLVSFIKDLNAQGITVHMVEYFHAQKAELVQNDLNLIISAIYKNNPAERGFLTYKHADFPDFDISQEICLNNEFADNAIEVLGEYSYDYDKVPGNSDNTPYQPFIQAVMDVNTRYEDYAAQLLEEFA